MKKGSETAAGKGSVIAGGIFLAALAIGAPVVLKWDRARGKSERRSADPPDENEERARTSVHSERRPRLEYAVYRAPRYARDHSFNNETVLVWGGDHEFARDLGLRRKQAVSNLRRIDYAGADSCRECHEENHELWRNHTHRWMNALADESTVKGDFSGGGTEGDSRIIEIFALRPAPVCWDALMRQPRAFQTQFRDSGGASAYFHVISRVAGRELLFGDEAPSGTS